MTNPLLARWDTAFEIAPFDQIKDDDFAPALDQALAQHQAWIAQIAQNQEPAGFANVIEALETPVPALEQVLSVFFSVAGADSNPAREALQREFSPKLAAHFSAITANKALYARVKAVWDQRDSLDLTEEQARVLMLTHRGFVRGGAAQEGETDLRMQEIKGRLAVLGTDFTQNLLADERDWYMELAEKDLEGLPEFVIDAARAAGVEKGSTGPVVTLSRSLITPFLQFSPRRDLRQKAFAAFAARGANGGASDNREIAAEILALRAERAALLGYDSFAGCRRKKDPFGWLCRFSGKIEQPPFHLRYLLLTEA